MMRRGGRIVNEMEFRMLRAAKALNPSARAGAMKRFSTRRCVLEDGCSLERPCHSRPQ
jgi:hypothetical protein